ncbi:MAG: hypothetical protein P8J37_18760 [Fuerstiella sp.]|nr:hypothetical protein [Fuerstiella sp.]
MENSANSAPDAGLRILARLILIPWFVWAVFWTWFVAAGLVGEKHDGLPVPVSAAIFLVYASLYLVSVISAFRLRTEVLGGKLLVACGALILVSVVTIFYALMWFDDQALPPLTKFLDTTGSILLSAFVTLCLPPIVAGLMLISCRGASATTGKPHV